jgi:hypothetical protein
VRKTWVDNVIKKIAMLEDHALILFALSEIMYSCGCLVDIDVILWVEQQIQLLATRYPNVIRFMKYLTKHWLHKAAMWCVGNHNIPHACQDTNASIESYHTNIKDFGMFKKKIDLMPNGLAYLSPCGRCVF